MSFGRKILVITVSVVVALGAGCSDKTSDYERTDLYQITQLLTRDAVATSIYPQVWLDVTNRALQTTSAALGAESITPQDYWVEIVSHKRTIPSATDSCLADDLNQDNPCAEIQVDASRRAHVRNATIMDSLVCRYHIIDAVTQSVTIKNVTYFENLFAMMAKFNPDDAAYRGWSLYAISGHWQRSSNNAASPVLDSVVLEWADQRLVSRPKVKSAYLPVQQIPHISRSEPVTVDVYANTVDEGLVPEDIYVHYEINGVMKHFAMEDLGDGHFYSDIAESSAGEAGICSQIVIEAFHPVALRDANPNTFGNFIWAISYRVSE
ncbi:MAG: hypothetical protein NT028_04115 [candidate division Zixibacteria bacterium]|nr:hypothetical protein [candidate division Zixibacteria bacterium]